MTSPFIMSFPVLFDPKQYKGKGDPKFSLSMLFDPDDLKNFQVVNDDTGQLQTKSFNEIAAAIAKAEWGEDFNPAEAVKNNEMVWPVKKGSIIADKKGEAYEIYRGKMLVTANSSADNIPSLVYTDENGKIVQLDRTVPSMMQKAKTIFYAGAVCRAELNMKATISGDKKYISRYLNSVLFVKDGTRLGNGGQTAFERFGGIDGGTSDIDPTAGLDNEIPT